MRGKTERTDSILRGLLKHMGLSSGVSRHGVLERWPKIVGPRIARHAKAERISGGTLFIAVDSSAWMHALVAMKQNLLDKVNAHVPPDVAPFTEIRFAQRSWAASPEPAARPAEPEPPAPTESELRIRDQLLAPVRDEGLREVIRRLWERDRVLKWRRGIKTSAEPGRSTREDL
jgi:hypothetical protein